MRKIETSIEIQASPEAVWEVLTNFSDYENWNPFIVKSQGVAKVGSKLVNGMKLGDKKPQFFKPTVLVADDAKELKWLGSLFFKGLFDGEHYFRLSPIAGGSKTRLDHGENFKGLLVGMIMGQIGGDTQAGFEAMNQALKNRVEKN